jgi:diaminohydroxyphosphoribosylaminopyrimidine deaminase / 5-amino-6-(5-phosphoribosylamino)uracil reductase
MDDGVRRLVVRAIDGPEPPPGVEVVRLSAKGDPMSPRAIVDALFERGLKTLLIEGGAWTVSGFIDANAVDRLHVLVAPMILGSGKTGLALKPIARLAEARRPLAQIHLLADGDVLFDCNLRQNSGA